MNIEYVTSILPSLMSGLLQTLKIFALTIVFSLPLALPISLGLLSRFRPVKLVAQAYVWVFRGTPLMLQLFFFWYLPVVTTLKFDRLTVAIITFILNYAAYFAEIYRGGIQSIDRGQREAAKSLGFSSWESMRYIVLPQALRRVLPPISNEVITLVKDTALVSVLGVFELMKAAKDAINRDVNTISYVIAAIIYLTLTFILTMFSQYLEKRLSRHERKDVV